MIQGFTHIEFQAIIFTAIVSLIYSLYYAEKEAFGLLGYIIHKIQGKGGEK